MRSLLLFLFITAFAELHAQAIITTHKEIRPPNPNKKEQGQVLSFPIIAVRNNTVATKKINALLQSALLQVEKPKPGASLFRNVWVKEGEWAGTLHDVEWKTDENNKQFLSLSISAEGCGAYCEYFTRHFSFDLRTGDAITVKQLVNTAGQKMIADSLHAWVIRAMDTYSIMPPDSVLAQYMKHDPAAKERFEEMKVLYTNCYWRDNPVELDFIEFSLTKESILFVLERCSNHANRAIDELDNMKFSFPVDMLRKYFTDYGKKILSVQ